MESDLLDMILTLNVFYRWNEKKKNDTTADSPKHRDPPKLTSWERIALIKEAAINKLANSHVLQKCALY